MNSKNKKIDKENVDKFVNMFPDIAKEKIKLKESVQKWSGEKRPKPSDYKNYTKHQEKIAESSGIYKVSESTQTKKVYLEDRVEELERLVAKLTKRLDSNKE